MSSHTSTISHAMKLSLVAAFLLFTASAPAQVDWKIFRPSNTGVLGDWSYTLWVDDQDRPWVAGHDPFRDVGGMSRRNPDSTWTVVTNDDSSIISSPRFYHVAKAPNGVLWIGTDDSLLKYDPAIGAASLQRFDRFNSPLPNGRLYDVAVAPDGTVWCAVFNVNNVFQGGLAKFNPATNAWNVWSSASTSMPWAAACASCSAVVSVEIQTDFKGDGYTVWFHGEGGGFGDMGMASYHSTSAPGTFTWYGQPFSIPPGAPVTPTGFFNNHSINDQSELLMRTNQGFAKRSPAGAFTLVPSPPISSVDLSVMVPLNNGRYGAASYLGDVFLFSGASWQYLGNWNGNHTYALDEESNGALWVCGIGGAARYANGQFQRYRVTNTGPVGYFQDTVAFGNDGKVYLDGNAGPGYGGFEVFDGNTWTCVNNFNYGLGPVWGLPSDDVQAMCFRGNGRLALSPEGIQGLLEWDGTSYTYLIPQGFEVSRIVEDTLGQLWAAQQFPDGVSRVTGPGQYTTYTSSTSPLTDAEITAIVPDPTTPGWVWAASMFGISHTNGDQWDVFPRELLGLTQNSTGWHITCLDRASDGTLWVGSGQGLYHFNPATLQYTQYTTANSALATNFIQRVKVAPDGSIWVAARDNTTWPYPGGLSHFQSNMWTTYNTANSPLRHVQIEMLDCRSVPSGYEIWVGMMSEGVARITVAAAPPTPGDVNGDAVVNVTDLLAVINAWGACGNPCLADLNHDGVIGVPDLLMVINNWS